MRREVAALALALCSGACTKEQEAPHAIVASKLCQWLTTRLESNEQRVGAITEPKCTALAELARSSLAYKDGIEEMFGAVNGVTSQDIGIVADFTHTTALWAIGSEECSTDKVPEDAAAAAIAAAKNVLAAGRASLAERCTAKPKK